MPPLSVVAPFDETLAAILLGIIEGITEFLPISSTGHLLIAEHWLGHRSDLFNISIQAGAILAVVAIYRQRLWQLLVGFRQHRRRDDDDDAGVHPHDYFWKLTTAFAVTAIGGLLIKAFGWSLPVAVEPIAWTLLIGGVWMLLAEHLAERRAERSGVHSRITWTVAVLVGIAQVIAGMFPGTSRSAATIFVALLFGTTSRIAATEFAFLVGIPTMFAATAYEALHMARNDGFGHEDWSLLAIAFVVSAITAFIAVKWLLRYIESHRFTVFAVYRILLGAALLVWLPAGQ